MFRWLLALLLLLAVALGGAYVIAGRSAPPRITIDKPDRVVGQASTLEVTATAPNAQLDALTIALEQNGKTTLLYALQGAQTASVTRVERDQLHITRPLGK